MNNSPLLKSERLSVGTKLALYKALIRSTLTYACLTWKFAAESQILKLQRQQNKVSAPLLINHATHRLVISTCRLKFLTKLCREQETAIRNHENVNIRNIGQGEARQMAETWWRSGI
jgi:hypothetical protein